MNKRLSLPLLTTLLVLFSFHASLAEDKESATSEASAGAPSEYELDDTDRIPPVPILRMQKDLDREFDDKQISDLKSAHKERVGEVAALNKKFLAEVSEITGLSEDEILGRKNVRQGPVQRGTRPAGKAGRHAAKREAVAEVRFIQRVELIMEYKGEDMSSKQKRAVDRAWEKRSKAVADIQQDYARQVADIANVSLSKVKRYLHLA